MDFLLFVAIVVGLISRNYAVKTQNTTLQRIGNITIVIAGLALTAIYVHTCVRQMPGQKDFQPYKYHQGP